MSRFDYDLICIGTGTSGSVAAHIAADAGKKVAVVEASDLGGESPNWACVPTKALLQAAVAYDRAKQAGRFGIRSSTIGYNYPTIKAWKDLAVKRTGTARAKQNFESEGIDVLKGRAQFISDHEISVGRRHYSAANFIIATGARELIPDIEGLNTVPVLTAHTAIDLNRPPRSLFVVGGGAVGVEFAQLFSIFGSKVYIAEINPRLLPKEDQELGDFIGNQLQKARGAQVLPETKVIKIEKEGLQKRVYFRRGAEVGSVKVEEVLLAAGKEPNVDMGLENAKVDYTPKGIITNEFMQTSAKHIFAVGDVVGPYMYTHAGIYQSRIAAHNLLHRQKVTADYRAMPRVTFAEPELAAVGITEHEAIKYATRYQTAIVPLSLVGRANVSDYQDGFVKVIADHDGKLIGAAIAAPDAGEMIHTLTLAVQMKLHAHNVANTIFAYPTWSEAIRIACSKIK